jgi:site-specific DNA recombinase
MKSCFGYIRVSTQKQGEGVSLEAQKDAITAFASRNNLQVIEWFEEKETAAKSRRPVFTKMLKLLERGRATGLIIHKIDRSARNLKDWAIISELSDKGVGVYFATESLDFRSRGGRLTADIQAVIAADYIRNLREETKKGIDGRLRQGLYPFQAPLGYLDNGRGKPKTPCPVKAPLVRNLLEQYASGQHSLRSLHREAVRIGLKNHRGGKLSLHGIETMLQNPFYCGIMAIKQTGATYDGIHEPLITVRTYRTNQDVKAGKAGKKVTRHNHRYRGLFRCALCNGPLSPEKQKGRVYYRCQTAACPTTTIREDKIEEAVEERFRTVALRQEEADVLRTTLLEFIRDPDLDSTRRSIDLRIDQQKQRMDRLTDLLIDGTISKPDFEAKKQNLALELAELAQERSRLTENLPTEQDVQTFLELATSLDLQYKMAIGDERRHMVQNLFSNRTLSPAELYLEPQSWLQDLKNNLSDPDGDPLRNTSRTEVVLGCIRKKNCLPLFKKQG